MKNFKQTKNVTVRQMIGTVTEYLTTRKISVVLTLLGVFSPFLHLFAYTGQKGVFGWSSMANFLDSFGWGLFAFFIGLSMLVDITDKEDKYKLPKRLKAFIIIAIGGYYMAYTIIPINDFSNSVYYSMLGLIGILVSGSSFFTIKIFRDNEAKLLNIIDSLSRFIVKEGKELASDKPKYIKGYLNAFKRAMH